jgi:hypothetical protein
MARTKRINIAAIVVLVTACATAGMFVPRVTGQEKAVPRDDRPAGPKGSEAPPKGTDPTGAVIATIKDVTLTEVDEAGGTISVSFGKKDKPTKVVNVPLADGVRLVASHVLPGSLNNLPFEWVDLKRLKGKVVSVRVRTSATGISVTSICAGND